LKKAVVLLSGGLDSTTALFWTLKQGLRAEALAFDYGQRHRRELSAARAVAKKAGVVLHEVELALPWLKGSSLVDAGKALPDLPLRRIGIGPIPSTYVPGRNTVFVALGISLADAIGASAVVIGANALDYSGYPDCRPEYYRAFARVAAKGTKRGAEGKAIRIVTPLIFLDKRQIVQLARKVGAPLELTWSCYEGAGRPCGRCDSCKLRAKGFLEAGAPDPALP
jgi:7-cyano-7-deazaguanine synthase